MLSRMLDSVRGLPDQFPAGARLAADVGVGLQARRVVVAGMGGSAFPGNFLRAYLGDTPELRVSRAYTVPYALDAGTLVLACSFSGNTEETLAAFDDARERGASLVAISSGGMLEERARAAGVPHVGLPGDDGLQPRAATGYFFGAMLAVLDNAGLHSGAREILGGLAGWLRAQDGIEERGRALAAELEGRVPVIYATEPYADSVARAIKIKCNENAKIPAFWYALPELNHNEMVGYTQTLAPFLPVLLRDPTLPECSARRLATTAATLREADLPVMEHTVVGETVLQRLFHTLWLFDFASCYLAERLGVDPEPVAMIERFKRALRDGAAAGS